MSQVPYGIPQIARYGIPYFSEEQGLRVCGLTEGSRGTLRTGGSKRIRLSIGNHRIRSWIVYLRLRAFTVVAGKVKYTIILSTNVCGDYRYSAVPIRTNKTY